eukprot:gene17194-biopygen5948
MEMAGQATAFESTTEPTATALLGKEGTGRRAASAPYVRTGPNRKGGEYWMKRLRRWGAYVAGEPMRPRHAESVLLDGMEAWARARGAYADGRSLCGPAPLSLRDYFRARQKGEDGMKRLRRASGS